TRARRTGDQNSPAGRERRCDEFVLHRHTEVNAAASISGGGVRADAGRGPAKAYRIAHAPPPSVERQSARVGRLRFRSVGVACALPPGQYVDDLVVRKLREARVPEADRDIRLRHLQYLDR